MLNISKNYIILEFGEANLMYEMLNIPGSYVNICLINCLFIRVSGKIL